MQFVEDNYSYIDRSAACIAVNIAEKLGDFSSVEDYKQDVILWICRRQHLYDRAKGTPSTFIAMLSATAAKRIIRRARRKKNWIIKNARHL